jgi:hypothetical protein
MLCTPWALVTYPTNATTAGDKARDGTGSFRSMGNSRQRVSHWPVCGGDVATAGDGLPIHALSLREIAPGRAKKEHRYGGNNRERSEQVVMGYGRDGSDGLSTPICACRFRYRMPHSFPYRIPVWKPPVIPAVIMSAPRRVGMAGHCRSCGAFLHSRWCYLP